MKLTHRLPWILVAILGVIAIGALASSRAEARPQDGPDSIVDKLAVVWTSGDPDVAHRVCLMYTHAAERAGWAGEVTLIVWGPSARLLAADKDLQAKIQQMKSDGVTVLACIACADSYGVTEDLRAQGIEVKPMGRPLTEMLRDGYEVLTF